MTSIDISVTESGSDIDQLIQPSLYDNNATFLYKQAIKRNVPMRFILSRPQDETNVRFIETFDVKTSDEIVFTSIFDLIREIFRLNNKITLMDVWDIISGFEGDKFNALEVVPIFLHSNPGYMNVNLPDISKAMIYNYINSYYNSIDYNKQFTSMEEIVEY